MFCPNCGAQIEDGARFCPECGTQMDIGAAPQAQQPPIQQQAPLQSQPQFQQQAYVPQGDGQYKMKARTASLLCYWFSFIGWTVSYMLADNKDPYLRFHLNQSLILWIAFAVTSLLTRVRALSWLGSILSLAVFVLWLIAFINAYKGEAKSAPLLDKIPTILK